MSQSPPADHRHVKPRSRHDGCNHQRRLAPHSASRMFIHLRRRQIRPIEHHAGMKHRLRQRGKLRAAHPAPNHSHQPRSNLVVGNMPTRNSLNKKLNLFAGEFRAVSLFADEVNNSHEEEYAANLASSATHVNEREFPIECAFRSRLLGTMTHPMSKPPRVLLCDCDLSRVTDVSEYLLDRID